MGHRINWDILFLMGPIQYINRNGSSNLFLHDMKLLTFASHSYLTLTKEGLVIIPNLMSSIRSMSSVDLHKRLNFIFKLSF